MSVNILSVGPSVGVSIDILVGVSVASVQEGAPVVVAVGTVASGSG